MVLPYAIRWAAFLVAAGCNCRRSWKTVVPGDCYIVAPPLLIYTQYSFVTVPLLSADSLSAER